MKTYKQFRNEKTQVIEIPTTNSKIISDLRKSKLSVSQDKNDKSTYFVSTKSDADKRKLLKWMLSNGWDEVDIRDGFPNELGYLI